MTDFAFEIEMAQNSNHSIRGKMIRDDGFFELKKVSHFGKKTRDPYFEEKIKEKLMVRILSRLDFKCISSHVSLNSFDDFLSHLTIPPVSYIEYRLYPVKPKREEFFDFVFGFWNGLF